MQTINQNEVFDGVGRTYSQPLMLEWWWFVAAALMLLAGTAFAVWRYRQRNIARTRVIEGAARFAESALTTLRADDCDAFAREALNVDAKAWTEKLAKIGLGWGSIGISTKDTIELQRETSPAEWRATIDRNIDEYRAAQKAVGATRVEAWQKEPLERAATALTNLQRLHLPEKLLVKLMQEGERIAKEAQDMADGKLSSAQPTSADSSDDSSEDTRPTTPHSASSNEVVPVLDPKLADVPPKGWHEPVTLPDHYDPNAQASTPAREAILPSAPGPGLGDNAEDVELDAAAAQFERASSPVRKSDTGTLLGVPKVDALGPNPHPDISDEPTHVSPISDFASTNDGGSTLH